MKQGHDKTCGTMIRIRLIVKVSFVRNEKEGPLKTDRSFHTVNTDRELFYKLAEMRKKAREQR